MLSFNIRRGEGLLPGAERLNRLVEYSKHDAGSETGMPGSLSSFFNDSLLTVHLYMAQIEHALKHNHFAKHAVLQTSAAALVAEFHAKTGQERRNEFGSMQQVIAIMNQKKSIYQNINDYSPKSSKEQPPAAYNAAGKGGSPSPKGKDTHGKTNNGIGKAKDKGGKVSPSHPPGLSQMGQQKLGDSVMHDLRTLFGDDFAKVLEKCHPPWEGTRLMVPLENQERYDKQHPAANICRHSI